MDAAAMRRLLLHEARVDALPGRSLRDQGDSILLHDPSDPEPFWNRLEAPRWPADANGFDQRLTESLVTFAAIGRQPHIWASPLGDSPDDLVARLTSNGFRDLGKGDVMVLADRGRADLATVDPVSGDVTLERLAGIQEGAARAAASAIVDVLLDAFDVGLERRARIEAETVTSLAHPWFTHYLVRTGGMPAAVARRATFDGASYLSSIGTAGWARGRGLGSLVTRAATADGLAAASEWIYLGVFAENRTAIGIYERSGFVRVGESCPDLLLV